MDTEKRMGKGPENARRCGFFVVTFVWAEGPPFFGATGLPFVGAAGPCAAVLAFVGAAGLSVVCAAGPCAAVPCAVVPFFISVACRCVVAEADGWRSGVGMVVEGRGAEGSGSRWGRVGGWGFDLGFVTSGEWDICGIGRIGNDQYAPYTLGNGSAVMLKVQ